MWSMRSNIAVWAEGLVPPQPAAADTSRAPTIRPAPSAATLSLVNQNLTAGTQIARFLSRHSGEATPHQLSAATGAPSSAGLAPSATASMRSLAWSTRAHNASAEIRSASAVSVAPP